MALKRRLLIIYTQNVFYKQPQKILTPKKLGIQHSMYTILTLTTTLRIPSHGDRKNEEEEDCFRMRQ